MAVPNAQLPCMKNISLEPKKKISLKRGLTFSNKHSRVQLVVFSSILTEICGQLAKLRNANIHSRDGAAIHSW